jgi:hypothetical protein
MYSACVVESPVVREAVLCDEHGRIVVFFLDPVQFLTESPRDNLGTLGIIYIYIHTG